MWLAFRSPPPPPLHMATPGTPLFIYLFQGLGRTPPPPNLPPPLPPPPLPKSSPVVCIPGHFAGVSGQQVVGPWMGGIQCRLSVKWQSPCRFGKKRGQWHLSILRMAMSPVAIICCRLKRKVQCRSVDFRVKAHRSAHLPEEKRQNSFSGVTNLPRRVTETFIG